jgi:hypothetical protein
MIVNPHYIVAYLNGLVGMADDDACDERFRHFDSSNMESMKAVIRSELRPSFESLPEASQRRAKLSLQYYLTTDLAPWEGLANAYLLPFDLPKPPRLFFLWIWEVFYDGEPYKLDNISKYHEESSATTRFDDGD